MADDDDDIISTNLARMAAILLGEDAVDEVLGLLLITASSTLENVVSAGIVLRRGPKVVCVASSDASARLLEEAQLDRDGGPSAEAIATGSAIVLPDISLDDRWFSFRELAARHRIRSVLSLPIGAPGQVAGSCSFYAGTTGAFDESSRGGPESFFQVAQALILGAVAFTDAVGSEDELRAALESREMIGIAKGILMQRENITDEEAFEMLKRISQNWNIKLRDVAARIVENAGRR